MSYCQNCADNERALAAVREELERAHFEAASAWKVVNLGADQRLMEQSHVVELQAALASERARSAALMEVLGWATPYIMRLVATNDRDQDDLIEHKRRWERALATLETGVPE